MRQHIVPKSYLSNFTDLRVPPGQQPGVWTSDLADRTVRQLRVEAVAARTDYYTVEIDGKPDDFIEEMFGELEGQAIAVIRTVSSTLALPTDAESGALAALMAIQHLRVPAFRDKIDQFYVDVTRKLNAIATEDRDRYARLLRKAIPDRTFTEAEIDRTWEFARDPSNYSIKFGNNASLQPVVGAMEQVAEGIARMRWSYLIAPEGSDGFVTSDNPVAWTTPDGGGFYRRGFAAPGTELTWPVTRRIAILAAFADGDDEMLEVDQAMVDRINIRTLSQAQRYIFASTESLANTAIRDTAGRAIEPEGD